MKLCYLWLLFIGEAGLAQLWEHLPLIIIIIIIIIYTITTTTTIIIIIIV